VFDQIKIEVGQIVAQFDEGHEISCRVASSIETHHRRSPCWWASMLDPPYFASEVCGDYGSFGIKNRRHSATLQSHMSVSIQSDRRINHSAVGKHEVVLGQSSKGETSNHAAPM